MKLNKTKDKNMGISVQLYFCAPSKITVFTPNKLKFDFNRLKPVG